MRAVSMDMDMDAEQILAGSGYGRECLHSVFSLADRDAHSDFAWARIGRVERKIRGIVLAGCGKSRLRARRLPSAAKAVFKTNARTAAVNRCATQNQVQHGLFSVAC